MRAPRAPQRTASARTRSELARLEAWYAWSPSLNSSGWSMGRVRSSLAGVVARMRSCSGVNAGSRWPDWEEITTPAPPAAITFSKLFQNKCGAIQIHLKDLLDTRLTSGNTRGVDETRNIAQQTSLVNHAPHRFGGRDVNRCCTLPRIRLERAFGLLIQGFSH